MRWTRSLLVLTSTLVCLAAATPASAEWFADLYLGGAFTEKHDVEANSQLSRVTSLDVSFDKSFTGGVRGGYWFPFELGPINFGVGMDLSHFRPDIGRQTRTFCSSFCTSGVFDDMDLSVWTIGFDAMFRFPLLKSAQFPMGQLQPYITVGPAIFVAHADDNNNFSPSNQSNDDTSVGVKVGAGVAWHFTKVIAMFGEYRYTHFSPEFTFVDNARGITDVNTSINTHYVLVGVSFRF
ncbi:MAG TPA: outer membrane beta-barrel protein [Methylomirabilota bacterium]|nr:outer membrane beta-barrel protein [Methylomirabilota bacterium]